MKYLVYFYLQILSILAFHSFGQCSFQYISNDTVFQDNIELINSSKNVDEIITIGSRNVRGFTNDSVYNAPFFEIFDYCGNLLNKTVYKVIENYKIKHEPMPTHNTYKEEPIGNTMINTNDSEFLIVDKAIDTLLKKPVIILFRINVHGILKNYKTLGLSIQEMNENIIKNVLQLNDGKILVILWNNAQQYYFYYFDNNLDFLYQKSYSLGRGIRSLKEIDGGEFICTSLAYDNTSFQFYRLDTNGEIKWMVTPFDIFGSAREVQLENNRIYVTGGITGFGVFLICDMEGNILNEFKYNSFYCKQRFCSTYLDSDHSYIIGGYIQHCESADKRGADVAILKIDDVGNILWNKVYDYRNALGTSGVGEYYMDYGGFMISKANDGGIVTNGMSKYTSLTPGSILNEDALLIKTEPIIVTNAGKLISKGSLEVELSTNLISNSLILKGQLDLIKNWVVYSMNGEKVLQGNFISESINTSAIESGMYVIKIVDRNNCQNFLKFVKI